MQQSSGSDAVDSPSRSSVHSCSAGFQGLFTFVKFAQDPAPPHPKLMLLMLAPGIPKSASLPEPVSFSFVLSKPDYCSDAFERCSRVGAVLAQAEAPVRGLSSQ